MLTYISPSRATKNNVNVGETKQLQVGIWSTGPWPASTRIQCQLLFLSTLFGLELETRQFSRWKIQNISKTSQKISSKGYLLYMMHIKTIKIRKVKGLFLYSTSPWKSEPRPKTQDLIINYVKWIYGVPWPMFIHVLAPSKRIKLQQLQPPRLNCGSSKEIWATWTPARLSTSTSNSSETPPRCPRGTWKLHPWGWLDFFHPRKRNECPKKGCHFKKVKACLPITIVFRGVMSKLSNMLSSTCRGS